VQALPHDDVQDDAQIWQCTVLVTNAQYDLSAIGQLHRDRCDCENGFDELKNQWGWGQLHHARHAPQPDHGAGGGAGLQLVELVRAGGQPAGPARGADQSAAAAGGGWRAVSHAGQNPAASRRCMPRRH
jgi:hypothetical protein